MEALNVLFVLLAALGSARGLASGSREYQQAVDLALDTVQTSSDRTMEVAEDAVVKIEDIVNSFTLAAAEARFSLTHTGNFANNNNLTALQGAVPASPSEGCAQEDVAAIKAILQRTCSDMILCFSAKVGEAGDILKATRALKDQAAAIMPTAVARIGKCSENTDVDCLETELKEILDGSAAVEHDLAQNVVLAEALLSSFHADIEPCMGHSAAMFIADVGKFGSRMVSCFASGS